MESKAAANDRGKWSSLRSWWREQWQGYLRFHHPEWKYLDRLKAENERLRERIETLRTGLEKAVAGDVEWVDANIIRLLLDRDGGR